jgi:hypothetical protein
MGAALITVRNKKEVLRRVKLAIVPVIQPRALSLRRPARKGHRSRVALKIQCKPFAAVELFARKRSADTEKDLRKADQKSKADQQLLGFTSADHQNRFT